MLSVVSARSMLHPHSALTSPIESISKVSLGPSVHPNGHHHSSDPASSSVGADVISPPNSLLQFCFVLYPGPHCYIQMALRLFLQGSRTVLANTRCLIFWALPVPSPSPSCPHGSLHMQHIIAVANLLRVPRMLSLTQGLPLNMLLFLFGKSFLFYFLG